MALTMSTVAEMKAAFERLPERDAWELAGWIEQVMEQRWDQQIAEDIAAGRLDKLADQAIAHYQAGRVKPLREFLDHA